jgi:hypothetical protein
MQALPRSLVIYILAVVAVGAAVLARAGQNLLVTWTVIPGIALFAVMASLADLRQLQLSYKANYSVATAINFGAAIIFGPAAAAWVGAIGSLTGDVYRRKPWFKTTFNACAIAISVYAGGTAMRAVGMARPGQVGPSDVRALAAYVAANLAVNKLLVCAVIALATRARLWDVLVANYRGLLAPIVALYPLGVLTSLTYIYFGGWPGLVLLAVPTLAVYGALDKAQQLRVHTRATIEALADTIDCRDRYTAEHSRRVADYVDRIAVTLGISLSEREVLVEAARVHDLGKISTPDAVLRKRGDLDQDEWQIMRDHPRAGQAILEKLPMYREHAKLVGYHHERVDGRGYPRQTAGEQIPFGARILAVADAFDAMTSDRPYRAAMPHPVAVARLRAGAGTQFAPEVVEALARALGIEEEPALAPVLAAQGVSA